MRASRKKMINVTCNQDVRKRVDEFLCSEYQAWKEDKEPRRYSNGIFTCGNETNNTLIMEYIHCIYNEYQIQDPLLDNKNDGERETSLRNSQKSQKSHKIEITSYNRPKPDSVQVKIVDTELDQFQPEELSQKDFEEEKNQELITPFKKIEKNYRETEPNKGLYDSREATTHYRENSAALDNLEKSRYSLGLSLENKYGESKTPKQSLNNPEKGFFQFSNKIQNLKLSREGPIPEVYRYCLACENAVLDINVERHEISCEEFQKLYEMDLEEILSHITAKINSLRLKLKSKIDNLTEEDPANMRQAYENMNLACDDILSSGQMTRRFIHNYDAAIKIGKKWSLASEEINKLRWFIKVREEIKKHFEV